MGISRTYRLKSRKRIEQLYADGDRHKKYPIHLLVNESDESEIQDFQVAFSAPKRIHRKASERNRLKRLMREAFRPFIPELTSLMEKSSVKWDMMLIYVGKEEIPLAELSLKIKVLLDRLKEDTNPHDR